MSKLFKVLDPFEPSTCRPTSRDDEGGKSNVTDWDLCALCQEDTGARLLCPGDFMGETGSGYRTMAQNLLAFDQISSLPSRLNISRLDDGGGVEVTLKKHQAKWHDTCRLQFNKTQLQRAQKRKSAGDDSASAPSSKFTRQSIGRPSTSTAACFFCEETSGSLHEVSTFQLDVRVRQCALKLQGKVLLAKLSGGVLIAQEAKYHTRCLASLYNKARDTHVRESTADDVNHGIAFAGLVSYIEDAYMDNLVAPVFKLKLLVDLYTSRLEQLGTHVDGCVHSGRLKDRLLSYFPSMEAHKQGRDVVLVSNEDVGAALGKACEFDADNEGVHLARAAAIVRRDMAKMKLSFSGSFAPHCQEDSVPVSLLALVSMVLYGPNITSQSSRREMPQPALSLAQLLMFNSVNRRKADTTITRHNRDRETPVPLYVGVMTHTKTRKSSLVDKLFELGLSVSYDRVLEVSTEIGNKVCRQYEIDKAVCPPNLREGLFTTAAVDNIDHNPSSTSAHDSFHGTGISLFQHPDAMCTGSPRVSSADADVPEEQVKAGKMKQARLPDDYTCVPPVALPKKDPSVPECDGLLTTDGELMKHALQNEYR